MTTYLQTLMMIDDDEDDREIFLAIVAKARPYLSVTVASNGQDALQKLKNAHPLPDLIFLDMNMPLMNGRQFMLAVKRDDRLHSIPVIVLTTSADTRTITDMMELGAKDFFTKPDKYSGWEKMLQGFINPA